MSKVGSTWQERPVKDKQGWKTACWSADGTVLVAGAYDGLVYTSTDGGQSWIRQQDLGIGEWRSVSCSADGTVIVLGSGSIAYTSTDSGQSWTPQTDIGDRTWCATFCSPDGDVMGFAAYDGALYISTDGGQSWGTHTANWTELVALSASADGMKLAVIATASDSQTYIYTSADMGDTWTQQAAQPSSGQWQAVTYAADGSRLAACAWGGYLYTSTTDGLSWQEATTVPWASWADVALSGNGMKLTAVSANGNFTVSTDGGQTWTQKAAPDSLFWYHIACSADGMKLVLATDGSPAYLYVSTDQGETWAATSVPGPKQWVDIVSSDDGDRLAAAAYARNVYLSADGGLSWDVRPAPGVVNSVACSADGMTLVVLAGDTSNFTVSTDGGQTWATQTGPWQQGSKILLSADGNEMVASGYIYDSDMGLVYGIYSSNDGGQSWNQCVIESATNLGDFALSADGTRIVVLDLLGYIYSSTDNGSSWTPLLSAGRQVWSGVAMSADGTHIVAGSGYICTSVDSGQTWTTHYDTWGGYDTFACSHDGQRIIAARDGMNSVAVSGNAGATWNTFELERSFRSIAVNADVTQIVAVETNGSPYISTGSWSLIHVWDGTAWQDKPLRIFDGMGWRL